MKNTKLLLTVLIAGSLLTACHTNNVSKDTTLPEKNPTVKSDSTSKSKKSSSVKDVTKESSSVEEMNSLAKQSKSTEEIYATGDIVVGENGDVKPGIYDLEITGGSGNIFGNRKNHLMLFINWLGGAPGTSVDYPSKIRIILFEGDSLELKSISKVKFTAVPAQVQMTNELGIGEYVVGRDIKAGTYKLTTNVKMDPQFDNLGWTVDIYNISTKKTKEQTLTPGNQDVVVKLEDGDIISTSLYNTDQDIPSDDARLIFTEYK